MDDRQFLTLFREHYGQGTKYKEFDDYDDARLKDRLPEIVRTLFKEEGLCSYSKQEIWTCDPDDWNEAGKLWLPEHPSPEVFGRTSFGDLFIWSEGKCWIVSVCDAVISAMITDAKFFLGITMTDKQYWKEAGIKGDTRKGKRQVGELRADEIYVWVPALALGGSKSDSKVEKSKGLEGHTLLRHLQEPVFTG